MKRIAVLQSNYIPWKGVFDLINSVDEFILYDDVQYTTKDWRNRNKIKTHTGLLWLTIPIAKKTSHGQIQHTQVANHTWGKKHWQTLHQFYTRAPYFDRYAEAIKATYEQYASEDHLSRINYQFYQLICGFLGITTPITWSMDYSLTATEKNRRLIELCHQTGGTHYLSGPAAKNYMDPKIWAENQINLDYFSYEGYPEYPQLFGPFEHFVSVLDLLFNTGPNAREYMLSFSKEGN